MLNSAQECPDIDLYVYFVCALALPSRDPFASRFVLLFIFLSLSLSRACLSSSIPSSDALSSQLHIGSACSVSECICPTLPDDTPAPNRRPRRPLLPFSIHFAVGLVADDSAIDALHPVTKLEPRVKALKCPPKLLLTSSHKSRRDSFFRVFCRARVATDFSQTRSTQYRRHYRTYQKDQLRELFVVPQKSEFFVVNEKIALYITAGG